MGGNKKMMIEEGNIVIKKEMTNIGEEAVTIRNKDGEDEFIMLFEYDWDCLMTALEKFKAVMGEWKAEEPKW